MIHRKDLILNALGIARWRIKPFATEAAVESQALINPADGEILKTSSASLLTQLKPVELDILEKENILVSEALNWTDLQQRVTACTRCNLCNSRTQTVFEAGIRQARCLVVGEAPGAEEDAYGEPFVGQAGKLLDNMLASVGLSRQKNVYICNVLKCRPPGNRNPTPIEVQQCSAYLMGQIELVSPDVLLLMGRFAAQSLLNTEASLSHLRGRVHTVKIGKRDINAIVSYHPAYLLRNLPEKLKSWADLLLAKQLLNGSE
ncbi:MAG: uracil-DNA glycosylase [Burkholderiaceae bacterium]|nr:uracil-DNA glycosylase [Burkholderiaceae bacterium]